MPTHIKTEQLFFVRELFVVAPGSHHAFSSRRRVSFFVKQRNLADRAIAQSSRGAGKRFVDAGKKLGAVAFHEIKRAGFDQTLQHFAIGDSCPDSSAKIFQRSIFPCPLPLLDRHLHRRFADVFDRGQPITDRHFVFMRFRSEF